eukprot:2274370-Pyramimonas_sp.AAC.1
MCANIREGTRTLDAREHSVGRRAGAADRGRELCRGKCAAASFLPPPPCRLLRPQVPLERRGDRPRASSTSGPTCFATRGIQEPAKAAKNDPGRT